jgi:hypothetical protein
MTHAAKLCNSAAAPPRHRNTTTLPSQDRISIASSCSHLRNSTACWFSACRSANGTFIVRRRPIGRTDPHPRCDGRSIWPAQETFRSASASSRPPRCCARWRGWRSILLLNLPITVAAMWLALRYVDETRDLSAARTLAGCARIYAQVAEARVAAHRNAPRSF